MPNPGEDRVSDRLRDFELHRPLGFCCMTIVRAAIRSPWATSRRCSCTRCAAAQLTVGGQMSSRRTRIAQMSLSLSGAFCPTSAPLFQGSRRLDIRVGDNILNSYYLKKSSEVEIHLIKGIPTGWRFSVPRFDHANSARDAGICKRQVSGTPCRLKMRSQQVPRSTA